MLVKGPLEDKLQQNEFSIEVEIWAITWLKLAHVNVHMPWRTRTGTN